MELISDSEKTYCGTSDHDFAFCIKTLKPTLKPSNKKSNKKFNSETVGTGNTGMQSRLGIENSWKIF